MNKLRIIFLVILLAECVFGTIRYVSKTGSSTPPYTSWETASDSIQKCINICVDGDTVIVANGVYKETLLILNSIYLLGSSMDSCIIDGTGLMAPVPNYEGITINARKDLTICNFKLLGKGQPISLTQVVAAFTNNSELTVHNCQVSNAYDGIGT